MYLAAQLFEKTYDIHLPVPSPNQMEGDVSRLYIFTGTHFGAQIVMYALSPTDHVRQIYRSCHRSENVICKYFMNVLSPNRFFRSRTFQALKRP